MDLRPKTARQPVIPSAEYFIGDVSMVPLMSPALPARARSVSVTFQPGARTAWHTHPLGQTLVITDGCGIVQSWGEAAKVVQAGDVVWFSPGEKHWHGAGPASAMTHIAIQEALEGITADWMEHVASRDYKAAAVDEMSLLSP